MKEKEKLWTIAEASKNIGISESHLRSLCKNGHLSSFKDWKGERYFHPGRLKRWLEFYKQETPDSMLGDTYRRKKKARDERRNNNN